MGNVSEVRPSGAAQDPLIRAYLETVLAAPAFAPSPRRAKLLRYLVHRTLAGEGPQITEYGIGLDVFDKPAAFDPRLESLVRTEVSRLRQKLKDHYAGEGQADAFRIEFLPRSYVPLITIAPEVITIAPAVITIAPEVITIAPEVITIAPEVITVAPAAGPPPAVSVEVEAPRPRKRNFSAYLAALGIAAALAGGFAILRTRSTAGNQIKSLVVLPFENLSPNHENEYLADGLTEELTNVFAQWKDVRVVARTSAFQFKGKGADIREIGRKLNVDAALEGSVAKQGDRIRITAQLIGTSDGYHLWSKAYDARSEDMMAVQQEIAASIAGTAHNLDRTVPDRVATAPPTNPEALDLYLQGSYQLSRYTPDSVKKSILLFQSAGAKDPRYARAFLGIASAEFELIGLTAQPPLAGVERVRAALRKVLELDPRSADAHGLLAKIAYDYDWDWPTAEREFQLALEQGARPGIRAAYGWGLATRGRFSEAHHQCRIAQSADPLGMGPRSSQFWAYYFEHNYPQAKKTLRGLLDLNPDSIYAHALLGLIAALEKNCAESSTQFEWVARTYPMPVGKCGLAYASACRGDRARAVQYLKEAAAATKPMYTSPYQLALGYAFLHDKDKALAYLSQSAADREGQIHYLKYEPVFEELRSDPRYVALEKRVGIQP